MRSLLVWLGVGVSLAFSVLAVRQANLEESLAALRAMNYAWLVPALATFAAGIYLRAVRWRFLFDPTTRPPLGSVAAAMLIGYLFNNILPLRAGEAARVLVLNRSAGTSRSETAATVVLERIYDVLMLLVLLLALTPWLPDVSWIRAAAYVALAMAIGLLTAALALTVWGVRPIALLLRPFRRFDLIGSERLEQISESLARGLIALRRPRIVLGALCWTMLTWLVLGLSYWLVMLGFGLGLSPLAGLLVTVALGVGMILPSSPAAVGVFETATIVALAVYGIGESEALSYAVVLHALNFVPFLVVGFPLLHRHGVQLRRGRRSDEAAAQQCPQHAKAVDRG